MNRDLEFYRRRGIHGETFTRVLRPGRTVSDAALVTAPNNGVPAELLTFLDPQITTVLTAVRAAREITNGREVKKGDVTDITAKFPVVELTGHTEPYDDFVDGGTVGVNFNWVARDNYLFSTTRKYGDLAEARTGEAKISLSSQLQRAAAHIIDVDANRFYFRGVAGLRNYGLLNDPNLNPSLTPAASGTGSSPLWKTKTTQQIYEDILTLFQELVTKTGGNVRESDEIKLVMSPAIAVLLAKTNDLGYSVLKMLKDYFSNLTIIKAPEYATEAGELMQMIAEDVEGEETVWLAFSEKFYAFAPFRVHSRIEQKFRAGTYGAIVRRPAAIASMLGM